MEDIGYSLDQLSDQLIGRVVVDFDRSLRHLAELADRWDAEISVFREWRNSALKSSSMREVCRVLGYTELFAEFQSAFEHSTAMEERSKEALEEIANHIFNTVVRLRAVCGYHPERMQYNCHVNHRDSWPPDLAPSTRDAVISALEYRGTLVAHKERYKREVAA